MPNNVQQVGVGTLRVWCGCAEEPASYQRLRWIRRLDLPTGLTTSLAVIAKNARNQLLEDGNAKSGRSFFFQIGLPKTEKIIISVRRSDLMICWQILYKYLNLFK